MSKIQLNVEVSKEMYEVGVALANIWRAAKEATKDGWSPAGDLPAIVFAALQELPAAISGLDKLDDELAEDPAAFTRAIAMGISEIYGAAKS
jgi:hypothetical protein